MSPVQVYYPVGVEIPNYVANKWSTLALVLLFAAVCTTILTSAKFIAKKVNPLITTSELSKVLWFTLCGSIHLILEGHYAAHFSTLAHSQHILAQLWKEYSLSDSRYLISDAFVMCMESITAWCWGPLSFLLAYFITTDHAFRHPLQIVISTGQLYGTVLYFGTAGFGWFVNGIEYSRPEGYYFYGYFLLLNGFWVIIPSLLIADSVRACGRVFAYAKTTGKVGRNGDAKTMP